VSPLYVTLGQVAALADEMLQITLTAFLAIGTAALTLKLCLFEYDDRRGLLIDAIVLLLGVCALYIVVTQ
jgi:hypothetical protein